MAVAIKKQGLTCPVCEESVTDKDMSAHVTNHFEGMYEKHVTFCCRLHHLYIYMLCILY